MKNFKKAAFISFGALTAIASGTTIVSCGRQHHNGDKPQLKTIFNENNLQGIVRDGLNGKLKNQPSDLKELTFTVGTIINQDHNRPYVTITGQATVETMPISFSQKISYNYKLGSYLVDNVRVTTKKRWINLPGTKIDSDGVINVWDNSFVKDPQHSGQRIYKNPQFYQAVFKPIQNQFKNIWLNDFKLSSKITLNNPNAAEATSGCGTITGHFYLGTGKNFSWIPFSEKVTNYIADNSYKASNLMTQEGYTTKLSNKRVSTIIDNQLYQTLQGDARSVTKINFGEVDGNQINTKVLDEPKRTIFGSYLFKGIKQNFRTTITYRYQDNSYSLVPIEHHDTADTILNHEKLIAPVQQGLYKHLGKDVSEVTNIKFIATTATSMNPWSDIRKHVYGIYTLAGETKTFREIIKYQYSNQQYSYSLVETVQPVSKPLQISKDPNVANKLNIAVKTGLKNCSKIFDMVGGAITFPDGNYKSNTVTMKITGHGAFGDDLSPAPFSGTMVYDLYHHTYKYNEVVIKPAFDQMLTKDKIRETVRMSILNLINLHTLYLDDFSFSAQDIKDPNNNNRPAIQVIGSGTSQGPERNFAEKISFSEIVTYDYSTAKYTTSQVTITKRFAPLSDQNVIAEMTKVVNIDNTGPAYLVTKKYFPDGVDFYSISNMVQMWMSVTYIKNTQTITVSGELTYDFTKAAYSFKADQPNYII